MRRSGQQGQPTGRGGQPAIQGPEFRAGQSSGDEKMDVHPAHAAADEVVAVDELDSLLVAGGLCARHFPEKAEHLGASLQPAERQLTEDERVDKNEPSVQKRREPRVASAQMIDPD